MRAVELAVLVAGLSIGSASAQSVSLSEIGAGALAGTRGNVAANISSGAGNAQSRLAVIAVGAQQANADIRASHQTESHGNTLQVVGNAHAVIGAGAFAGSTGILAVHQASGNGNAQANLVGISAAPVAEVTIDYLANVHATRSLGSTDGKTVARASGERSAVVADSAFTGATGIVQVNQLAGSGNTAANAFALSVGASPR
jgi:hypothetical protein